MCTGRDLIEKIQRLEIWIDNVESQNRKLNEDRLTMLRMFEFIQENYGHIDASDFGFPTLENYIVEVLNEHDILKKP